MRIGTYETHSAADLFPLLGNDEAAALRASIRANGLRQPIVRADGLILDGRNRLIACIAENVEPRFVEFDGGNPWQYVWDLNAERRHMEPFQKAAIAVKFATESEKWQAKQESRREAANRARSEAAKGNRNAARNSGGSREPRPSRESKAKPKPHRAADEVAESARVSVATVRRAMKLKEKDPEKFEAVVRGEVSGPAALAQVKHEAAKAAVAQAALVAPEASMLTKSGAACHEAEKRARWLSSGGFCASQRRRRDQRAHLAIPLHQPFREAGLGSRGSSVTPASRVMQCVTQRDAVRDASVTYGCQAANSDRLLAHAHEAFDQYGNEAGKVTTTSGGPRRAARAA